MNDVIASKRSSLKPKFVATTMFLKLNVSLITNNPTCVVKSPIWNTLIPSLELPDDIDDSDDNQNEEEEDDDLSPMLVKSEEVDYTC
jgi:hypothetical protein